MIKGMVFLERPSVTVCVCEEQVCREAGGYRCRNALSQRRGANQCVLLRHFPLQSRKSSQRGDANSKQKVCVLTPYRASLYVLCVHASLMHV